MIDEPSLKASLVTLAELQRTHYLSFSALLNEVAALRETVRGLDPTFADVIEQKRVEQELQTRQVVAEQIGLIDDLIRLLKMGVVFEPPPVA